MTSATREKIVSSGLQLFREHGFGGVGLDQILRDAGLTKTTFYNHFESKEDLVRASIEVHQQQVGRAIHDTIESVGSSDPIGQILAVFDIIQTHFLNGTRKRCLGLAAAIEYPSPSDPIYKLEEKARAERIELLQGLCKNANLDQPERVGTQLVMLLDGAAISLQIENNTNAIATAKLAAEQVLRLATQSNGQKVETTLR